MLGDVFILKKPDTSKKARQFALRFFIYKKLSTLLYAIFIEYLKLLGGGEPFYTQKTIQFALHFYMQKTIHFPLRFIDFLRSVFISKIDRIEYSDT